MEWLLSTFPILKSPQFWGTFVTVAFQYLRVKGWLGEDEANAISILVGSWTANGLVLKAAKKVGGTVNAQIENVEEVKVTNSDEPTDTQ